jgi:hypothetical protein
VVVSHTAAAEPVFNYGNAAALALFGYDFATFTALPSSASAPQGAQAERAAALAAALGSSGCARGYSGVRVTRTGRRFTIEGATLWTLRTLSGPGTELGESGGKVLGQAATFSSIVWLDPPGEGELGVPGERWRFAQGGKLELVPAETTWEATHSAEQKAAALATLHVRVADQASAVRALKDDGLSKGSPEVDDAVALLLQLKAELADAAEL